MKYVSTRGTASEPVPSAVAIKRGLAPDGGLYMPDEIPTISADALRALCGMGYAERAATILSYFLTDYGYDELLADCKEAYSEERFPGGPAPLFALGPTIRMLELWHGPTCAFKDMALQIMPKLLSRALKKTDEQRTAFILVATSGDTGKAALEGYRDVDGVKIMVFYPVDGVSNIQKRQMATQEGNNVAVCAVRGNFDDAQNGVKRIFSDSEAAELLNHSGYFFSSANSINWGRLVPQVVYYVSAYCDMVTSGDIAFGDRINICVPTGNFGNIFAAYIAKCAGLPVGQLICASNCNNVLTGFFDTGVYDRNREFHTTMSPSMDILISSNLERLLYLVGGSARTADYMKKLSEAGRYTVDEDIKEKLSEEFYGTFCDESATEFTIKTVFERHHYLCDTHTAVGLNCALKYLGTSGDTRRILVASTASPYKFAPSVYKALTGQKPEGEFETIEALSRLTGTPIPRPLATLMNKEIRFTRVIDPENMVGEVYADIKNSKR